MKQNIDFSKIYMMSAWTGQTKNMSRGSFVCKICGSKTHALWPEWQKKHMESLHLWFRLKRFLNIS